MKYLKTLNEYYKGSNSTIGFRYSEPKMKSNIKIIFITVEDYDSVYETFKTYLNEFLSGHEFKITDITAAKKEFIGSIPKEQLKLPIEEYKVYILNMDLTTYDEDEIYSLYIEIRTNIDEYIFVEFFVNDKFFDTTIKYRQKKKIGF